MKKAMLAGLAMGLFLVGTTGMANATTITLQPGEEGKDTWIWSAEDSSHGDWGELRANQTSEHDQRILIEFDLAAIATSWTINSAILELYRYDGMDGISLDVHNILTSWDENVIYSNSPSFDNDVVSTVYVTSNGWYSWDITSLVRAWVDNSLDNNGIAIYDHGSGYYQRFVSSDNASATMPDWALPPVGEEFRPKLTIDYTAGTNPVPEPATMLLLGSGLAGLAGFRRKFKK